MELPYAKWSRPDWAGDSKPVADAAAVDVADKVVAVRFAGIVVVDVAVAAAVAGTAVVDIGVGEIDIVFAVVRYWRQAGRPELVAVDIDSKLRQKKINCYNYSRKSVISYQPFTTARHIYIVYYVFSVVCL